MSLAAWAFVIGCVSLAVAAATLGWQVLTRRLARKTQLEVRFGHIPNGDDDELQHIGIEVVNHSDFPVHVQDVQLVFTFGDHPEPVIVGLRAEERATIPGTVQPHDSGFIASGIPIVPGAAPDMVFANAITAVGNVRTPAYEVDDLPPLPAPMRFNRLFPPPAEEAAEEE